MNGGVKVNKTDFEITITEKHKLNLSFITLFLHSYTCILYFQIQLIFLVIFWALTKNNNNNQS